MKIAGLSRSAELCPECGGRMTLVDTARVEAAPDGGSLAFFASSEVQAESVRELLNTVKRLATAGTPVDDLAGVVDAQAPWLGWLSDWMRENRSELARDLIVGVVVALLTLALQGRGVTADDLDRLLEERQEQPIQGPDRPDDSAEEQESGHRSGERPVRHEASKTDDHEGKRDAPQE